MSFEKAESILTIQDVLDPDGLRANPRFQSYLANETMAQNLYKSTAEIYGTNHISKDSVFDSFGNQPARASLFAAMIELNEFCEEDAAWLQELAEPILEERIIYTGVHIRLANLEDGPRAMPASLVSSYLEDDTKVMPASLVHSYFIGRVSGIELRTNFMPRQSLPELVFRTSGTTEVIVEDDPEHLHTLESKNDRLVPVAPRFSGVAFFSSNEEAREHIVNRRYNARKSLGGAN